MKKQLLILLAACLPFTCFSGCGKYTDDCISVGVNLALTGVSAPYGTDALAGIRMATEKINAAGGIRGRSIRLEILDNTSRTDLAATCTERLEGKRVQAIIGPSLSHLTRAALKALGETCLLTPGSTALPLKPCGAAKKRVLRLCFTDQAQGEALAAFALAQGKRRAAVVYDPALDYSVSLTAAFRQGFAAGGGEILCGLPFTDRMVETAPLLCKILAVDPDCILLPVFYEKAGLFIRQLRQSGCMLPVFSGDGFDNAALTQIAGSPAFLQQVYYTDHADPAAIRLQAADGTRLSAYTALGYDSAMTLYEAMEKLPAAVWREKEFPHALLYSALLATKRTGLTGAVSFTPEGNAVKKPVLLCFSGTTPVQYKEDT